MERIQARLPALLQAAWGELGWVSEADYEAMEKGIRQALKAEMLKKHWPRSGRY